MKIKVENLLLACGEVTEQIAKTRVIRALGIMLFVIFALFMVERNYEQIKGLKDIPNIFMDSEHPQMFGPTVNLPVEFNMPPEPVAEVAALKYNYSVKKLGFHLKDINFLNDQEAAVVEKTALNSLPLGMQRRAKNYMRAVFIMAEKYQVDPFWVLSVIWTESHFNYRAKSNKGARGLMQIMPTTYTYLKQKLKRKNVVLESSKNLDHIAKLFPHQNVHNDNYIRECLTQLELGVYYLKNLKTRFNSYKLATVAYNMGPTWTSRRLRRKLPIGNRNMYLKKVTRAYGYMARRVL